MLRIMNAQQGPPQGQPPMPPPDQGAPPAGPPDQPMPDQAGSPQAMSDPTEVLSVVASVLVKLLELIQSTTGAPEAPSQEQPVADEGEASGPDETDKPAS